jgi:hypothetical protein
MADPTDTQDDVTEYSGEDQPAPVGSLDVQGMPPMQGQPGLQSLGGQAPQPQRGFHPLNSLRAMLAARGAPGAPTVSQVAQQHGGLLTGLAGVLLDGISAGMHAQATAPLYGAPGSNFARGFVQNEEMPQLRQQQKQAMWHSMSAIQKDQLSMLQAHVQAMQTRGALQRAGEDALMGLTEDQRKVLDQDIQDGITEKVYESDDYTDVQNHLSELRNSAGGDGIDYWAKPTSLTWDKDGNPSGSHWVIIKDDPNKTLGISRSFQVPDGVDDDGNMSYRTVKAPADMKVRDYRKFYEQAFHDGMVQWDLAAKQRAGLGAGAGDYVKVLDPQSGKARVMSRAEAIKSKFKVISPKVTDPEISKWTTSRNELGIAQKATSTYASAIQDYNNVDEATKMKDQALMDEIMNDKDVKLLGSFSIKIGAGGNVELPVGDSLVHALDTYARAKMYANLSPQAKTLFNAMRQMEAGAPAYSRAMLESARGATQQSVNLDLGMVPNPALVIADPGGAVSQLGLFQGNISRTDRGIPDLEGVDSLDSIRQQYEQGFSSDKEAAPRVDYSRMPKGATGTAKAKDGSLHWSDAQGKDYGMVQ